MLKPRLKQSVVLVKDLSEQPNSGFVLLVGSPIEGARPSYYAVDSYALAGDTIEFYRDGLKLPVFVCRRSKGQWSLVHRSACNIVDEEGLTRWSKEDANATADFYKELDPEAWDMAQKEVMSGRGGGPRMVMLDPAQFGGHQHPHKEEPRDDGKPSPGQYL